MLHILPCTAHSLYQGVIALMLTNLRTLLFMAQN